MVDFVCPFCGDTFKFCDSSITNLNMIEGCTTTCPNCGIDLLVKDGLFVDAEETFKKIMQEAGYNVDKLSHIDF